MVEPHQFRRCREDDPERCQANNAFGQCSFPRVEGSQYCPTHSGRTRDKAEQRSYKLTRWKGRVDDFLTSPNIKSLREEIGIARMTLEQILERCQDAMDIQLNSNKITQVLQQIEKLVSSCDRLETKSFLTLDKSAAILLAEQITNIISEEVEDPVLLDRIAERMGSIVLSAGQKELTNGS